VDARLKYSPPLDTAATDPAPRTQVTADAEGSKVSATPTLDQAMFLLNREAVCGVTLRAETQFYQVMSYQ